MLKVLERKQAKLAFFVGLYMYSLRDNCTGYLLPAISFIEIKVIFGVQGLAYTRPK